MGSTSASLKHAGNTPLLIDLLNSNARGEFKISLQRFKFFTETEFTLHLLFFQRHNNIADFTIRNWEKSTLNLNYCASEKGDRNLKQEWIPQ